MDACDIWMCLVAPSALSSFPQQTLAEKFVCAYIRADAGPAVRSKTRLTHLDLTAMEEGATPLHPCSTMYQMFNPEILGDDPRMG